MGGVGSGGGDGGALGRGGECVRGVGSLVRGREEGEPIVAILKCFKALLYWYGPFLRDSICINNCT